MEPSVFVKDVEVGAAKLLNFLTKAEKVTPRAAAAIAVVLGAADKAITDGTGAAAAGGLNILLDEQTAADLKAVWSDVKSDIAELGIKL